MTAKKDKKIKDAWRVIIAVSLLRRIPAGAARTHCVFFDMDGQEILSSGRTVCSYGSRNTTVGFMHALRAPYPSFPAIVGYRPASSLNEP